MRHDSDHTIRITEDNLALGELILSWRTAEYSAEDGIGPMGSLHEAGDSLVAVAQFGDDGTTILGSGVMVAPGLLLTATHVLDEFPSEGPGPLFLTFLPNAIRAWLPCDRMTISGPSQFDEQRKIVSDISLVSCTLNSEAHASRPLMLAPMEVALPLVGDRLWAMGFRHQGIRDSTVSIAPLITSGLVTAAFPQGRGERLASPCFEVEMDTLGGMSGGAVVNADGRVVGIVSSSLEGGPTHVTLIWEALRFRVRGSIPKFRRSETISLIGANELGFAKLKGRVERDPFGDITLGFSDAEAKLLVKSVPSSALHTRKAIALNVDQLEAFLDVWGSEMQAGAVDGALLALGHMSLPDVRDMLEPSGIPQECLDAIEGFSVSDFDGLEDISVTSTETIDESRFRLSYYFDIRVLVWTLEIAEDFTRKNPEALGYPFFNKRDEDGITKVELVQHRYFRGSILFRRDAEVFTDATITLSATKPRRSERKTPPPLG